MANKRTIERLSSKQAFAVMKLIEEHGKKEGDYWIYNEGWDDERVAAETDCNLFGVRHRRKEVFGNLRHGQTGTRVEIAGLEARIATLELESKTSRAERYKIEKRLEHLEKALNILLSAPNRDAIPKEKLKALREHFNGIVHITAAPKSS
jgi:hypothetical protein